MSAGRYFFYFLLSTFRDSLVILFYQINPVTMKNVLLIEDDLDIVNLLSIHLQDLNCSTESSSDGVDGLSKAMENQYDLVVLDVMLPKMDGLDVCREIRAPLQCETCLLAVELLHKMLSGVDPIQSGPCQRRVMGGHGLVHFMELFTFL